MFYFHAYLGKIPNVTNISQRGWNHRLDKLNLLRRHFDLLQPLQYIRLYKTIVRSINRYIDTDTKY